MKLGDRVKNLEEYAEYGIHLGATGVITYYDEIVPSVKWDHLSDDEAHWSQLSRLLEVISE